MFAIIKSLSLTASEDAKYNSFEDENKHSADSCYLTFDWRIFGKGFKCLPTWLDFVKKKQKTDTAWSISDHSKVRIVVKKQLGPSWERKRQSRDLKSIRESLDLQRVFEMFGWLPACVSGMDGYYSSFMYGKSRSLFYLIRLQRSFSF